MGRRNKALLKIEGLTFLERTVSLLRPFFSEIMIIGPGIPDCSLNGLSVHPDLRPGNGSLGGILTALVRSSAPKTLCVACDMPFLHPGVIAGLLERSREDWEVVIPRLPEGLEPLCAVYSAVLTPRIEDLLDRGERRIRRVLDGARTRFVEADELRSADPRLLTFFNINTPEDLERALEIAKAGRP